MRLLLEKSMAVSSKTVYIRAWTLFTEAISLIIDHFSVRELLPLTTNMILYFIGYLSLKKYASSSITTFTSAIGYVHKIAGLPNPTSHFLVQKMIASVNKVNPSQDPRLPITLLILHQLVLSVPQVVNQHYHIILLKAMFLVAFFGLMRVGEIAYSPNTQNPTISVDQLDVRHDHMVIKIKHFKHNISLKPFDIIIKRQADPRLCPVAVVEDYLRVRGRGPGPLFVFQDGPVVNKSFFSSRLHKCLAFVGLDPKLYQSHSFRIGAASLLASLKFSDSNIRMLGRWKGVT